MRILIATTNPGKFKFIHAVLDDLDHEFLSLQDLQLSGDVEETGQTYAENALIKAKYFHEQSGLPTIGEDSGIVIDALADELGVKTRRWGAGKDASDEEWIQYFLKRMESFPNQRTAKFISTIAFYSPEHFEETPLCSAETGGVITQTLEAPLSPGIPLSSCFRPNEYEKVYAAMTDAEKSEISHRGKAVSQLKELLCNLS